MSKKSVAQGDWRKSLAKQLKSCAKSIYYNADEIIGNIEHMTYPITVSIELTPDGFPLISTTRNFIPEYIPDKE